MTEEEIDIPDEPMKLTDLIRTGEMVEVNAPVGDELKTFKIWIRKPTPSQHQEATNRARGQARRTRAQYKDKESDNYLALMEQIEMSSDEELIDKIVSFSESDLKQAAYHKVLYGTSGSDWTEKGLNYLDLMTAIRTRMDEIVRHNEETDLDSELLALGEDPELKELLAQRAEFEAEVEKVIAEEIQAKKDSYHVYGREALEQTWASKFIELESNMAWFEAYKLQMVYHACRDPEKKDQLYFDSVSQIQELPFYVSSQLLEAYDRIDKGLGEVKNSLSPQLS